MGISLISAEDIMAGAVFFLAGSKTISYFLTLICEIVLSFFLFNYNFNIENIKMNIFIFLLIFYPTFYFFSKIDKLG